MGEVAEINTEAATVVDPMASMIERVALDPNVPFEKLEKMLDMQERILDRNARAAFDNAIADAKAEIGPILKTGEVDYTNDRGKRTHFKHETLDGIAATVDPILSKHGLSYRFRSQQEGGQLYVTCVVAHRDGYSEETTLQGAPDTSGSKNNYQAVGSAATYLQRYTLKLALGLSAAKDDDATGVTRSDTLTVDQFQELKAEMENAGADETKFLRYFQIDRLEVMPQAKFSDAMQLLGRKAAQ